MLGTLIKNDCNNLYLHPKLLKITLKLNSYLASIFRRGPVNPSTPSFPNINLTKTMTNLLIVWKMTEKGYNNLYLLTKVFHKSSKSNSYLMPISRRGPVNLSTPTFDNISLTEAMTNLLVVWKFDQRWPK